MNNFKSRSSFKLALHSVSPGCTLLSGPENSPLTLPSPLSWVMDRWLEEWESVSTNLHYYIQTPSTKPSGRSLSRAAWVRMNRLRTGWGKTNNFLRNIGAVDTNFCPCGAIQTTKHLIEVCPIFSTPPPLQMEPRMAPF